MNFLRFAVAGMALVFAMPAFAADIHYKIIDRLKMPDGRFDYASSDQARGSIYWPRLDVINIINAKTNAITNIGGKPNGHVAIPVPGSTLIVESHGGQGLSANNPNGVAIVDVVKNTVLADLPAGNFPDGGTWDPSSKLAYVALHNDGKLLAVDPRKRAIAATIDVGGHLEFPGADGHGHLFVNIQTAGEVAEIDTKTQKVMAHYKLDGCEDNGGLAVATRSQLVISACGNGVAKVLTTSGKEVASLQIGHGSDAVIYDAKRQLAFIPCAGEGVLYVISVADPKHVAIVQQVETQKGTRTGAVNETSGRVYLMASKPDLASPPGPSGRPNPLPGSFEMLVVAP